MEAEAREEAEARATGAASPTSRGSGKGGAGTGDRQQLVKAARTASSRRVGRGSQALETQRWWHIRPAAHHLPGASWKGRTLAWCGHAFDP